MSEKSEVIENYENDNNQDDENDIDDDICIVDKSLYESDEYQNILYTKRITSFCVRFAMGYLWDLVFIIVLIGVSVWLYYTVDSAIAKERFWAVLAFLIIASLFLIWADILLIIKTKKLKEYYPDRIKNLWILYLIGLFVIIPSVIASYLTNSICKKILNELDEKEDEMIKSKK